MNIIFKNYNILIFLALIAQNDEEGGPNVDYIINTGATVDDPSRQP